MDEKIKELMKKNPKTVFSQDVLDQIKWLQEVAQFIRYEDADAVSGIVKRLNSREREVIKLFDEEHDYGIQFAESARNFVSEET